MGGAPPPGDALPLRRALVRTGASTGPIAVTNPAGSATSAGSFTVIGAPTVTFFTPSSGPAGAGEAGHGGGAPPGGRAPPAAGARANGGEHGADCRDQPGGECDQRGELHGDRGADGHVLHAEQWTSGGGGGRAWGGRPPRGTRSPCGGRSCERGRARGRLP